jgi:hypothetical protein
MISATKGCQTRTRRETPGFRDEMNNGLKIGLLATQSLQEKRGRGCGAVHSTHTSKMSKLERLRILSELEVVRAHMTTLGLPTQPTVVVKLHVATGLVGVTVLRPFLRWLWSNGRLCFSASRCFAGLGREQQRYILHS